MEKTSWKTIDENSSKKHKLDSSFLEYHKKSMKIKIIKLSCKLSRLQCNQLVFQYFDQGRKRWEVNYGNL